MDMDMEPKWLAALIQGDDGAGEIDRVPEDDVCGEMISPAVRSCGRGSLQDG